MSHNLPPIPDFPDRLPPWEDDPARPFPPTARTGLVEVTDAPLDFTPVPRLRQRRKGFTPETQRMFIDALAQCGCVSKAARAVGVSPRSAYRLLEAPGADEFAKAWDQAIARGIERLRADAFDRAFNGAWVPVYRKGRLVRVEHRRLDRLAIALLSGREASVAGRRERAESRRNYRLYLNEKRGEQAMTQKQREAAQAAYDAELERMIEAANRPPDPRVRRL